ncbi:MAG: restriction endonuclease [Clostridia bacterium]|nr:restriction endonuclease [Clostridia bacterium]
MARYTYQKELSHPGLNKYRIVKAETAYELDRKVETIKAQWNVQWQRMQERAHKQASEQALRSQADRITKTAEQTHTRIDQFLLSKLSAEPLSFTTIRNYYKPSKPLPTLKLIDLPRKPLRSDARFNPPQSLFTRLFKAKAHAAMCQARYTSAIQQWETECERTKEKNTALQKQHDIAMAEHAAEKQAYLAEIDDFQSDFLSGSPAAMERFVTLQLDTIDFPFPFDHEYSINYDPANLLLVVDMFIPSIEDLPTLKQAVYVKTRNCISEKHFSTSDMRRKCNSFTYQVVLLVFHRLFSSISATLVDSIVLNGRVNTIDKANGQPTTPCILSVRTSRTDFSALNLQQVDPAAWFRHSKGVSAASFAEVTPVPPIINLQTDDKRFVDGYDVASTLSESVNLAAMHWLDFENLIRELFEQEFSQNGGSVRITQASRDGGVDAVAFDPDPIRGGKIVVQAKRYTNVVGVSAVRDLYGTIQHEGAMKGILVTTSTYGKDAYDFIVGKPITLISGAELLHLLERHGHKARIDIVEAKSQYTENSAH